MLNIKNIFQKVKEIDYRQVKINARSVAFGNTWRMGIVNKIIVYSMLVLFGFIFLYPLIYMTAYAFMNVEDIINPFVNYVPSSFYTENFTTAFKLLNYFSTLANSIITSLLPAVLQCISVAIIGYGLARFNFPFKRLIIGLIVATFIIPAQLTMIPQLIMFTKFNMNNIFAFLISAILGQGIQSAIFILIFYQFFRTLPKSLEEAAKIDGAGIIKCFIFIACPLVIPGFILTFLFSFVWYFNETTLTSLFFGVKFYTLPIQLKNFEASYREMFATADDIATSGKSVNEALYMAGTLLSILPLLLIYFAFQRFFIESVEKAGITGE